MNMGIGELARHTHVKVPTIRYYEQIGLLPAPPRTRGNQRRYGQVEVVRLNFIRHSRELGFQVEDIRELLALTDQPQKSCDAADSIARRHLREIDQRILQLAALGKELRRMIGECRGGRICDCRVIEILADHKHCRGNHH
jgi:DNA-binding transcriptional MerR regulator